MKVVLFDPSHRHWLYPFTLTRPLADLRRGIGTVREVWERITAIKPAVITVPYLSDFDYVLDASSNRLDSSIGSGSSGQVESVLLINAALMPSTSVWAALKQMSPGEAIVKEETLVALCTDSTTTTFVAHLAAGDHPIIAGDHPIIAGDHPIIGEPGCAAKDIKYLTSIGFHFRISPLSVDADILKYPWQLIQWNDRMLRSDFVLFTAGRKSAAIPPGNQIIGAEHIFVEPGARISCSMLNASTGPIYIGKDAEIMEGCLIRGPLAMGEGAILKMGTKVYGATTIGPYSVAGGEIKNVIMTGYSNKGHDGYLGDALLGEWCNLGAGTSNSNVRNNATPVRVWNPGTGAPEIAGPKAGLLMGDYSRSAIQTAFNTGAVVGICCNVFGGGLCSGYVPDFSWGTTRYEWEKVLRDIGNWKKLKGRSLTEKEIQVLEHIFGPK